MLSTCAHSFQCTCKETQLEIQNMMMMVGLRGIKSRMKNFMKKMRKKLWRRRTKTKTRRSRMKKKTRIMKKRISRTKKRMRKNGKNKKKKDEEDQVLDHPDNDIHGETVSFRLFKWRLPVSSLDSEVHLQLRMQEIKE